MASWVDEDEFPLSSLRTNVFKGAGAAFDVAQLSAPVDPVEALADLLRFRTAVAVADEFAGALRKCGGKNNSISFDVKASAANVASFFGWPALRSASPPAVVKRSQMATNCISYIVTDETLFTPSLVKELVVQEITSPKCLNGLLGD
jgi:hypothetical protein